MMKRASLHTHRPPTSYAVARNIRTHGEALIRRRERIALLWSGQHDGRCWTAQEIAEEIEIETHMVLRHVRALRLAGDKRAIRPPSIKNHKPDSPIKLVSSFKEAAE